ncbi:response regulator [bacterium]|nr:response regulator [bacterium]
MKDKKLYVLLVDDDPEVLDTEESYVEDIGFSAIKAQTVEEALSLLDQRHEEITFVLSDFNMPGINGLEFRRLMNFKYKKIPFALCSGYISKDIFKMSIKEKICAFLDKPCSKEVLQKLILSEAAAVVAERKQKLKSLEEFKIDALEIYLEMDSSFKSIASGANPSEPVKKILRSLHSLKGMASAVGLEKESKFIGVFKSLLVEVVGKKLKIDNPLYEVLADANSALYKVIHEVAVHPMSDDGLKNYLKVFQFDRESVGVGTTEEEFDSFTFDKINGHFTLRAPASTEEDDILVSPVLLDSLMDSNLKLKNELKNLLSSFKEYGSDESIHILIPLVEEALEEILDISNDVTSATCEMRKVSVRHISNGLSDVVRGALERTGKLVRISYLGTNERLDRQLINILLPSLEAILVGIVERCIESPEERIHMGKNKESHLTIQFFNQKTEVMVSVEDDGRGVAAKKEFSKAKEIIEKFKGSFNVKYTQGEGAKYVITVPKPALGQFIPLRSIDKTKKAA